MDPPEVQVGDPWDCPLVICSAMAVCSWQGWVLRVRVREAENKRSEVSYIGLEPQAQVRTPLPSTLTHVPSWGAGRFLTVADALHGCRPCSADVLNPEASAQCSQTCALVAWQCLLCGCGQEAVAYTPGHHLKAESGGKLRSGSHVCKSGMGPGAGSWPSG